MRHRAHHLTFVSSLLALSTLALLTNAASPPQPTYATANVDGNIAEWNLSSDFFASMYRAGDPSKQLESKAYLRYDCAAQTAYVLVLSEPGAIIEVDTSGSVNSFVKLGNTLVKVNSQSGDNGTAPDFAWVGLSEDGHTALGYEASFPLSDPGSYTNVNIHTEVFDCRPTSDAMNCPQTSAPAGRAVTVTLDCAGAPPPQLTPNLSISTTVTTAGGACPGVDLLQSVSLGDEIKYCYTVSNTGSGPAYNVVVIDDNGTPNDLSDDIHVPLTGLLDLDGDGQSDDLLNGASVSGIYTGAADTLGTVTDTATVTGSYPGGTLFASDPASIQVSEIPASLSIRTLASPDADCNDDDNVDALTVPIGSPVYFCYYITNTSPQTITNISVSDSGATVPNTIASLAPSETDWLVSSSVIAMDKSSSLASATGAWSGGSVTSNEDGASVEITSSAIAISVTASLDDVCGNEDDAKLETALQGTPYYYCYTVTNVGDNTLHEVAVVDVLELASGSVTLDAGQSYTFLSYQAVALDDESNSASASGSNSAGYGVSSNTDSAGIDVVHPSLSIAKTVSLDGSCPGSEVVQVLQGTTVTYCYQVFNTGDTTIDGITVSDNGLTLQIGTLAPGASTLTSTTIASTSEDVNSLATTSGIDAATKTPVSGDSPDGALVDVVHPSLSIAVTASLDGTCPGDEVVNVLEGTEVTWCYTVTNTGDVSVSDIIVSDDIYGLASNTEVSLAPGQEAKFSRYELSYIDDMVLNGIARGSDDATDSQVESKYDPAAINVVHPSIDVDVTVSLDGTCPGDDTRSVVAGSTVYYCFTVSNFGDDTLTDIDIEATQLGTIGLIAELGQGESSVFVSGPVVVSNDTTLLAYVVGDDLYGFSVSDDDAALVDALFADVQIHKSAPTLVMTSQTSALSYTLGVSNMGEATAANVVVTDTLPASLAFNNVSSSQGSCSFSGGVVTCSLGDLPPAGAAWITLNTSVSGTLFNITNTAYVSTETPESEASNNSSTALTHVAPGATRTIGFYQTHPDFVAGCLNYLGGAIDLGWLTVRDEAFDNEIDATAAGNGSDKDSRLETGLSLAMGVLNANVAKWTNGKARTSIEKARMQAGRQLLGAICNATYLGATPPVSIAQAQQTLAGSNISAILTVNSQLDAFNNSGDAIDLGVTPGPAVAKFPWDDPTDPND